MEQLPVGSIALSLVLGVVLLGTYRIVNWVWFRPKKIERQLREQGFRGNPYKLLVGDLRDNIGMMNRVKNKPIGIHDEIIPRVAPFLDQTVKTYGKNSFVWYGPIPRLTITDPEHFKEILTKMCLFRRPQANPLVKIFASGLISQEGDDWVKHRKILNPAFHLEKLKLMIPEFYVSSCAMVGRWEKLVKEDGTCELDVWPDIQFMTRDAISRTAFGSNHEEGVRMFELLKELADLALKVLQSVYVPCYRFLPTKTSRRMKEINREVQACLLDMISKREKAMKAGEITNNADLLGTLLESNMREIKEGGNNKNLGMTTQDVIDECKLFYFAGQETTSILLVWTMILLSKHPEWQAQAREEVGQVFGDKKPDFEGLNRLKIVTMILYEVLRLYPPVVGLTRGVYEDVTVGNLRIPAGVQLYMPAILMHYDKELWGPDVFKFKPERFAEGISKATKNQLTFFPFGWGPRICIGQNFALLETKMALATLLPKFSFEFSPAYAHAPFTVLTLQPQHGANLVLRKL